MARHEQIAERLRQARTSAPSRQVTVAKVVKLTGLSARTVNSAFRNDRPVADESLKKVVLAVAKLSGRSVASLLGPAQTDLAADQPEAQLGRVVAALSKDADLLAEVDAILRMRESGQGPAPSDR